MSSGGGGGQRTCAAGCLLSFLPEGHCCQEALGEQQLPSVLSRHRGQDKRKCTLRRQRGQQSAPQHAPRIPAGGGGWAGGIFVMHKAGVPACAGPDANIRERHPAGSARKHIEH